MALRRGLGSEIVGKTSAVGVSVRNRGGHRRRADELDDGMFGGLRRIDAFEVVPNEAAQIGVRENGRRLGLQSADGHDAVRHDVAYGNAVAQEITVVEEGFAVVADEDDDRIVEEIIRFEGLNEASCGLVEMMDLVCVGTQQARPAARDDFGSFDRAVDEDIGIVLLIGKVGVLEEDVKKERFLFVVLRQKGLDFVHEHARGD